MSSLILVNFSSVHFFCFIATKQKTKRADKKQFILFKNRINQYIYNKSIHTNIDTRVVAIQFAHCDFAFD